MSARVWPVESRRSAAGLRRHFVIRCSKCRDSDFILAAPGDAAGHPTIAKKFQRAGWTVGARAGGDLCPDCTAKAPHPKIEDLPMVKVIPTPAEPKPPTPSPAASARIAELYMMLDDGYDRAGQCYRPGFSDGKIAADLSLAVDFVAKRREQDFGPVRLDTLADDLNAEYLLLVGLIKSTRADADALARRAGEIEARLGPLGAILTKVKARLAA